MTSALLHRPSGREVMVLVIIGIGAGVLAGLFGVGGGIIIVPALTGLLGFDHRLASGTSMATMIVTALVGFLAYLSHGTVDVPLAALIAIGAVVGAWVGGSLLQRIALPILRWSFIAFLVIMVAQLFLSVPARETSLHIGPVTAILLILLGVLTGILAALLGVGGGIVVVPVLVIFFGVSEVLAKGTSLLVILPAAVSGTVNNARRRNLDLTAAILISIVAAPFAVAAVQLSVLLDPGLANALFAGFIVLTIVLMILREIRGRRRIAGG